MGISRVTVGADDERVTRVALAAGRVTVALSQLRREHSRIGSRKQDVKPGGVDERRQEDDRREYGRRSALRDRPPPLNP